MSISAPTACLTDEADRDRRVLASAWKGASEVLDYVFDLLDPPAALARRTHVRQNTREMLRDWLGNLAILVRRLLFITALGLTLPPSRPGGARNGRRSEDPFDADNPSGWRVSLRLFRTPGEPCERVRKPAAEVDAQTEWSALPFARRLEALRRVITHPERHARAVARRLARTRAANAGRNAPCGFAIRQWHIHSSIITPAQDFITALMDGTEFLAERWLARWQEPG